MEATGDAARIDVLLPALRRREQVAFHELYDLLAGPLQAYARARVGDHGLAEDVVQDVFLKLTKHVRRFRGDGRGLLAWLYVATRRRCVDVHRRRGRRPETPVAHLPEVAGAPTPGPGDVDPALQAALLALTDDQREAILLRRVAGLDGDEVAAVMGKDREAVYALCSRGEARLRVLLAGAGPPGAPEGGERTPAPDPSDPTPGRRLTHDEEPR